MLELLPRLLDTVKAISADAGAPAPAWNFSQGVRKGPILPMLVEVDAQAVIG
ncbi:hypothetical protein [Kitasatospora sp. HPMI-4]|uniref:hypothetical protein n=1 Tax=Kitasatospora sp. HPMI-4 TaxID=3448443 RepID=UPI003F1E313A